MLKSKIQVTASAFPLISTIQTCVFVSPKQNVCGRYLPVSTIAKTRESAVNIFHIFFYCWFIQSSNWNAQPLHNTSIPCSV